MHNPLYPIGFCSVICGGFAGVGAFVPALIAGIVLVGLIAVQVWRMQ